MGDKVDLGGVESLFGDQKYRQNRRIDSRRSGRDNLELVAN